MTTIIARDQKTDEISFQHKVRSDQCLRRMLKDVEEDYPPCMYNIYVQDDCSCATCSERCKK